MEAIQRLNRVIMGRNFEDEAYNFLKNKFDSVRWLSKETWSSPVDFECIKDNKIFLIEAKCHRSQCSFGKNALTNLYITKDSKGTIILLEVIKNNNYKYTQNIQNKEKNIINFLDNNSEEWFTTNQVCIAVEIHIYKAQVLLQRLFFDDKIENVRRGKYLFWRSKH